MHHRPTKRREKSKNSLLKLSLQGSVLDSGSYEKSSQAKSQAKRINT